MAGSEAEYKRALNLNPSYAIGHMWYADYLSKMGRHADAIAEAMRAREPDPISVDSNAFLGFILYRARRYDEALKACQRAVELDPYHPEGHWLLALPHEQRHELREAIAELEKAVKFSKGGAPYRALLANAYALAGERAKASSVLDKLTTQSEQSYVSPLDFAVRLHRAWRSRLRIPLAGEGVSGTHDAYSGTAATDLRQPTFRSTLPRSDATHRPLTLNREKRVDSCGRQCGSYCPGQPLRWRLGSASSLRVGV